MSLTSEPSRSSSHADSSYNLNESSFKSAVSDGPNSRSVLGEYWKAGLLLLGGLAGGTDLAAASMPRPVTSLERIQAGEQTKALDPKTIERAERLILDSFNPELSKYERQRAEVELSWIDPGAQRLLPVAWQQLRNLPGDAPKWQFEALSLFTLTRQLEMEFPGRVGLEHIREICENRLKQRPDGRPLAISVCAKGDHNGAFYIGENMYDEMIKAGYRVLYFEAKNDTQLMETLFTGTRLGSCYEQRAALIVIGGHGNRTSLVLERDTDPEPDLHGYVDPSDQQRFVDIGLPRVLARGGQVVLDSCSNGAGRANLDNIANFMRRVFPHAKPLGIWAATESYGPISLHFGKDGILDQVLYPVPDYRSIRDHQLRFLTTPEADIRR